MTNAEEKPLESTTPKPCVYRQRGGEGGVWESSLTKTPEPFSDVKIKLLGRLPEGSQGKPVSYTVRVYREQESYRTRLLEITYPGGFPISKLPRGAKKELKRVFPLAVLML